MKNPTTGQKGKLKMEMNENGLRLTIDNLIEAGTTYDTEQLDTIYHSDLQVIILDPLGQKMVSNKNEVKAIFQSKRDRKEPHLNSWAEFHHIEANGYVGHVLLTRKFKLMEKEQKFALSIDLVWEDDRWQVSREVVSAIAGT